MSLANRFNRDNGVESLPLVKSSNGRKITHAPNAPPDRATMRGVESVKEVMIISPGEVVLDMVVEVRCNRMVCLFMIVLQCQEIITLLLNDLFRDLSLTSHRINRDNAALDGQKLQELWNRGDFVGLALCLELAYDQSTIL